MARRIRNGVASVRSMTLPPRARPGELGSTAFGRPLVSALFPRCLDHAARASRGEAYSRRRSRVNGALCNRVDIGRAVKRSLRLGPRRPGSRRTVRPRRGRPLVRFLASFGLRNAAIGLIGLLGTPGCSVKSGRCNDAHRHKALWLHHFQRCRGPNRFTPFSLEHVPLRPENGARRVNHWRCAQGGVRATALEMRATAARRMAPCNVA